jgi:hypothetical protein
VENYDSLGYFEGDAVHPDALPRVSDTSRAVLSFLRGLKSGSVFLVLFMSSMISSVAKVGSILIKEMKV